MTERIPAATPIEQDTRPAVTKEQAWAALQQFGDGRCYDWGGPITVLRQYIEQDTRAPTERIAVGSVLFPAGDGSDERPEVEVITTMSGLEQLQERLTPHAFSKEVELVLFVEVGQQDTRAGGARLHVECHECHNCGHVGINDSHPTDAACSQCDWSGPSPKEDKCPGCGADGTMHLACPKCSSRYHTLAEADTRAGGEPSDEFTPTSRKALAWVLWHHQGASSQVGQAMRFALGISATERMPDSMVADAKQWGALCAGGALSLPTNEELEQLWEQAPANAPRAEGSAE